MKTRKENSKRHAVGRLTREAIPLKEHLSKRLKSYAVAAGTVRFALPEALDPRLRSYAAAAGLFGAALLGTALPATADIVFTPASHTSYRGGSVQIALDNVHPDVLFAQRFLSTPCVTCINERAWREIEYAFVTYRTSPSNAGLALKRAPLPKGFKIGPFNASSGSRSLFVRDRGSVFTSQGQGVRTFTISYGPWAGKAAYLGVKFALDGEVHYGWIAAEASHGVFYISGWAYNTVPNEPINAGQTAVPEPGTLGLLALGSLGLGLWRRRKQEPVTSGE